MKKNTMILNEFVYYEIENKFFKVHKNTLEKIEIDFEDLPIELKK